MSSDPVSISVIVPTFQRRDLIVASMNALARQEYAGAFEVIVVIDGSTDGSAEALRSLQLPFPLQIIEQPNQGLAAARNRGAAAARHEVVLFLDDDMEVAPGLLVEHDRAHQAGADAVYGHMPLHPDSPPSVLTPWIARLHEERLQRLSAPGAEFGLYDYLGGQLSIRAQTFHALGGFDQDFTRGGSYGNEDVDFGYRLVKAGYRAVFSPAAVSWQLYVVPPSHHMKRWRQSGHADVMFARKHPEELARMMTVNGARGKFVRLIARPLASLPSWLWSFLVAAPQWLILRLAEAGLHDGLAGWLFFRVQDLEYWRGVREAGDLPTHRTLRVLAYHAMSELSGAGRLAPYGISIETFRRQLQLLKRRGFTFVDPDEVSGFIKGEVQLPRRAVSITFDDCYADLAAAAPVLQEFGARALVFAVSERLGGVNDWDGLAPEVRPALLDAAGLAALEARGHEVGSHSRSHPELPALGSEAAKSEIIGSLDDLAAVGLRRPRFFAYPYGENSRREWRMIEQAGLVAAFTIRVGVVTPASRVARLPRIEILHRDSDLDFLAKVEFARQLSWLTTIYEVSLRLGAALARLVKGRPARSAPAAV